MPIKFRCKHCRQFLGISRSKAGSVVDCPTCGRSIRVPELDGRVEPIPDPSLDLNDVGLVDALDQLASIGDIPPAELAEDEEFQQAVEQAKSVVPAPKPDPIPVEPPPPVEPIVPQPSPASSASQTDVASATTTSSDDALATLAGTTKRSASVETSLLQTLSSVPVISTLAGVAIVFFAIGLVIGKSSVSPEDRGDTNSHLKSADMKGNEADLKNGVTATKTAKEPALRGRITYETPSGDKREDWGARVIVFPAERKGSARLSVAGFRAADTDADLEVATATMKALGGALSKVTDDGTFEIAIEKPGNYRILVVSHFQRRAEDAEVDSELLKLVSNYFERPDQLLGRVSYHFGEINYTGEGTQPWDHSFERVVE